MPTNISSAFRLTLPHSSVVSSWYHSLNVQPGLTQECVNILKPHVNSANEKEHNEHDATKYHGYADHGTGNNDSDPLPAASQALTLMVVSLNCL